MSASKRILTAVSLIILITSTSGTADWKEDAKAIDISGGENHTLVLTRNKFPWACGPNGDPIYSYYGVLGTGSDDPTLIKKTLVRVHDGDMNTPSDYLEYINDIDAGWMHSLALDVNGFVWSWGYNTYGQLGDDSDTPRSTPVQVYDGDMNTPSGYLENIIAISAGRSGEHSLAVDANNFVWAWGRNYEGQIGNDGDGSYKTTPVQVHDGDMNTTTGYLEDIIAVSAGEQHSMALDANGFVWTWGDNEYYYGGYGKLGNGSTVDLNDTPVQVLSGEQDNSTSGYLENIVAISAGWDHCIALEKYEAYDLLAEFLDPNYTGPDPNYQGRVYTWGNNGEGWDSPYGGRLGNDTTNDSNTPVIVLSGEQDPCDPNSYLKDIIDISAGEGHSLALDVNGFVYAWGDNKYGQLGNGTDDPCTTPVKVVGLNGEGYLENIVAISAGFWHSLAIDVDGTIWTWGKGTGGRLGLGDTVHRNTPHPRPVVYNITQQTFYFKIQDAIDDANNGDVIVASPGTYYENIDFRDKAITVRSTDPNYSDVVANTTIDGSNQDWHLVDFNNGSGSVLAGFTLTNGTRGGLLCEDLSSVNITNCKIQNNAWSGIYLYRSSVNITNCKIQNNGLNDTNAHGISCWDNSDPNIINCTIEDNGNNGINCDNSDPNIISCTITGNDDSGIYCNAASPTISNCVISENGNESSYGGGIYNYNSSSPTITNCIFTGNTADWYGGGMYNSYQSSPKVANCVFSKNRAVGGGSYGGRGGGMANYQSSLTLINCTFRGNYADIHNSEGGFGGGMYNKDNSDPNVTNCIFWDNEADSNGSEIYNYDDGSDPNFSYCDIEGGLNNSPGCGGYPSNGSDNIDDDPCFVDPNDPNDYHLGPNSPCIDAGTNTPIGGLPTTDIDGEPRVIDGDGNDTEIVDMGADEYDYRDADFDNDGIVNFIDYAMFADTWQTENPDFSLDGDNDVDMNDLSLFVEDWLWQAGWTKTFAAGCGQSMSQGFRLMEGLYLSAPAKQQPTQIKPLDIEEIIKWLDEIWLDEEVRKVIDEDEWLKFMESLKEGW